MKVTKTFHLFMMLNTLFILVLKPSIMESGYFNQFPSHKSLTIKLDITDSVQQLSDEYSCGKNEMTNDNAQEIQTIINCKIENNILFNGIPTITEITCLEKGNEQNDADIQVRKNSI